MKRFFGAARKTILVAINFDEHADSLVRIAEQLCKQTGQALHLVHVCEPWLGDAGIGMAALPSSISAAAQAQIQLAAASKLREIAKSISKGITVTSNALLGLVADSINHEASLHHASLIVVGAAAKNASFFPAGFSTPLTLMGHANVPVLVVPKKQNQPLPTSLTILVADDLKADCDKVLEGAFDLAADLGGNILHLYANPLTESTLGGLVELAVAAGRTGFDGAVTAKEVGAALNHILTERMAERAKNHCKDFEKMNGHYKPIIVEGLPADRIAEFTEDPRNHVDMIAFGRHRTFHSKPFLIGRVPLKAMSKQQKPVLIIPPNYNS